MYKLFLRGLDECHIVNSKARGNGMNNRTWTIQVDKIGNYKIERESKHLYCVSDPSGTLLTITETLSLANLKCRKEIKKRVHSMSIHNIFFYMNDDEICKSLTELIKSKDGSAALSEIRDVMLTGALPIMRRHLTNEFMGSDGERRMIAAYDEVSTLNRDELDREDQ